MDKNIRKSFEHDGKDEREKWTNLVRVFSKKTWVWEIKTIAFGECEGMDDANEWGECM